MLRATRQSKGRTQSNIRWNYGHTTIPRHLRDLVATEYGVADLRGKTDRNVIAAMLAITDSRFQDELVRQAKDAGLKTRRTGTSVSVLGANGNAPAGERRPTNLEDVFVLLTGEEIA